MKILLLSDIHGNFPALKAIEKHFLSTSFDLVLNAGDSTVYGPFPNKTLNWLRKNGAISILGNTDYKVLTLSRGGDFKKPSKPDKKVMYTWTAKVLDKKNLAYLQSFSDSEQFTLMELRVGLFHGSPEDPDEFLFPTTAKSRFKKLAKYSKCDIIITGHSHTPYHKIINSCHFINPGSVGRMFDGNPDGSCAILEIDKNKVTVTHHRIGYPVHKTLKEIQKQSLPEIYLDMYRLGKKLN